MFEKIEKRVKTKDGVEIAFNIYKSGFDTVSVMLPGWFMTKDSKAFTLMSEAFCEFTDVVCIDFRGHGKSSGFYTFTSKEVFDIEAVVNQIKDEYKKIYITGFSLGASLSVLYAAQCEMPDKIIAVSPASDFNKIENHFWKKEAWLPTLRKAELKRWFSIRPLLPIGKKIAPSDVIEKVKCPILFIAGEKDPTVYPWHTEHLYKKAHCKKKYELFENCFHAEDLFFQKKREFTEICRLWLAEE